MTFKSNCVGNALRQATFEPFYRHVIHVLSCLRMHLIDQTLEILEFRTRHNIPEALRTQQEVSCARLFTGGEEGFFANRLNCGESESKRERNEEHKSLLNALLIQSHILRPGPE